MIFSKPSVDLIFLEYLCSTPQNYFEIISFVQNVTDLLLIWSTSLVINSGQKFKNSYILTRAIPIRLKSWIEFVGQFPQKQKRYLWVAKFLRTVKGFSIGFHGQGEPAPTLVPSSFNSHSLWSTLYWHIALCICHSLWSQLYWHTACFPLPLSSYSY